jgi:hypothetical protein
VTRNARARRQQGGRCSVYRPGWTVNEMPSTTWASRTRWIESCGLDPLQASEALPSFSRALVRLPLPRPGRRRQDTVSLRGSSCRRWQPLQACVFLYTHPRRHWRTPRPRTPAAPGYRPVAGARACGPTPLAGVRRARAVRRRKPATAANAVERFHLGEQPP